MPLRALHFSFNARRANLSTQPLGIFRALRRAMGVPVVLLKGGGEGSSGCWAAFGHRSARGEQTNRKRVLYSRRA